MKFVPSIKQNTFFIPVAPPDFRNMGTCLRILVIANLMGLAAAVVRSEKIAGAWQEFLAISTTLEPFLLASLLVLYMLHPVLEKLPHRQGITVILGSELAVAATIRLFNMQRFGMENVSSLAHWWLLTLLATCTLLAYFNLRNRALSPALVEARLQALQARIRPHFLFNSINAVLSLIRDEPRRAETALEDLADLFRVLMADNRQLVPLASEVALCRQYLALEKLRLGHRLHVVWNIGDMPEEALVPPLILQPLLENAVYHGIEPVQEGGEIVIDIRLVRDQINIHVSNPFRPGAGHHAGNHMAVENIRERLALHFDYEASLVSSASADLYEVSILLPYRKP